MTGRLTGKVAVVTGASRGIGRAIALRLAADGAKVVVHYNKAEKEARDVVAAIKAGGGEAIAIAGDLAEPDTPELLAEKIVAAARAHLDAPALDILVNNAGVGLRATIEEIGDTDFEQVLRIDLVAPFRLIKALAPRLNDGGRIINISSMGTRAAFADMVAYAPAKAGLEALTRALAVHFGPRSITVNAVAPGATATDLNPGARDPIRAQAVATSIALGRVGQPDDIAAVVSFLASDDGRWVTGQTIDASGGQRL